MEPWELEDFLTFQQIRRDERMDPTPDYFWRTFFGTNFFSNNDRINFAELPVAHRKIAPFVMPTSQGKPVFERRGGSIESFKPAYVKMKDAVRFFEANNVQLVDLINNNGGPDAIRARHDRAIAETAEYHLRAYDMRRCLMAAESFIAAQQTVTYEADRGGNAPTVVIDYGRDPSLDVTLTGQFLDDPDFPLVDFLSDMSNTMYGVKYGGRPNRAVLGSALVPYIQNNNQVKELLKSPAMYRGGEGTSVTQGMLNVNEPMSYIGVIGGIGQAIELWTYKDVVEAPNGDMVDLLDPRDMLMIAPGAGGVMAYGAIWDKHAVYSGNISTEVYQKMFEDGHDPVDDFVSTQGAPLAVNTNPNKVSRSRMIE